MSAPPKNRYKFNRSLSLDPNQYALKKVDQLVKKFKLKKLQDLRKSQMLEEMRDKEERATENLILQRTYQRHKFRQRKKNYSKSRKRVSSMRRALMNERQRKLKEKENITKKSIDNLRRSRVSSVSSMRKRKSSKYRRVMQRKKQLKQEEESRNMWKVEEKIHTQKMAEMRKKVLQALKSDRMLRDGSKFKNNRFKIAKSLNATLEENLEKSRSSGRTLNLSLGGELKLDEVEEKKFAEIHEKVEQDKKKMEHKRGQVLYRKKMMSNMRRSEILKTVQKKDEKSSKIIAENETLKRMKIRGKKKRRKKLMRKIKMQKQHEDEKRRKDFALRQKQLERAEAIRKKQLDVFNKRRKINEYISTENVTKMLQEVDLDHIDDVANFLKENLVNSQTPVDDEEEDYFKQPTSSLPKRSHGRNKSFGRKKKKIGRKKFSHGRSKSVGRTSKVHFKGFNKRDTSDIIDVNDMRDMKDVNNVSDEEDDRVEENDHYEDVYDENGDEDEDEDKVQLKMTEEKMTEVNVPKDEFANEKDIVKQLMNDSFN